MKHRVGGAMHLNTRASSRGKGSHSHLKGYVELSTYDLLTTYVKLNQMLNNQAVSVLHEVNVQKERHKHHHKLPLFELLMGKMCPFALDLLVN